MLDEIRFAPNWDRWLKQAVDASVGRIVATDSAASILRAGTRESGQGRWDELRIEGLSFAEFARLHAIAEEDVEQVLLRRPTLHEHYLRVGGFPEHAFSDAYAEVRQRLRADIAERAIFRDLLPLGVDLQRVKDLFVYLVQDSGSVFEAAVRARDLTPVADVRSVQAWVDLLETTLMLAPLDRFGLRPAARLRSGRRLYAADHGLIQAFAVAPRRDVRVLAQVTEAVVFRHLRDLARDSGSELSYYRKDDEHEIDFVLSSATDVIAIEVTSSRRLRSEKLKELRRAQTALRPKATLLIFGGVVESSEDDIRVLPLASFLRDPRKILEGVRT